MWNRFIRWFRARWNWWFDFKFHERGIIIFAVICIAIMLWVGWQFVRHRGDEELQTQSLIPIALIVIVVFGAIVGLFIVWWPNKKRTSISEDSNSYKTTTAMDDFYPLRRSFKVNTEPKEEDSYHIKLNYQHIIERLTRKMYILFVLISVTSISSACFIYLTSVHEVISPQGRVLDQYEAAISKIQKLEQYTEFDHINYLDTASYLSQQEKSEIISGVISQTVEQENKLISKVSSQFFTIYYGRYIAVRITVILFVVTFLSFQIRVYFRIRKDKTDYVRKEEALSVYFHFLSQTKEGEELSHYKANIPDFPLSRLFDDPDSKNREPSASDDYNTLTPAINRLIRTQSDMVENLDQLVRSLATENKKDNS